MTKPNIRRIFMRSFNKAAALMLCVIMLSALLFTAVSAEVPEITGTDKRASHTIKAGDKDTGVTLTQISLSQGSVYADSVPGILNVIELDKSNTDVAVKVLNGGEYTWSKATMGASAVKYNATGEGTVIAAMNGDPWIVYHTDYDGDGKAATGPSVKHVSVSRGMMIIDREIWATAQITDENMLAKDDNAERGTPSGGQVIFGVKEDGTGVIGVPNVAIAITASGGTVAADGLNRLPAPNSTIIYNHRCGTESFAYEDAYEIYLECDDTAFELNKVIKGKVTHIFESGDTSERPAITENTVVISARGRAIDKNKGKYTVGEELTILTKMRGDKANLSSINDWNQVVEATGGFYTLVEKGVHKGQELSTAYPTTIAGIKEDGSIILISTTTVEDGSRSACRMKNMQELASELGCYTAVMFDGGGSTQFISLEGDQYVRRSSVSDGKNSVRAVISGLAVVYKGADIEVKNSETLGTKFYDELGLQSTFGVVEDLGGAHIKGSPSYSYYYVGNISHINGAGKDGTDEAYTELIGMRDPNYSTSWTSEQKAAAIMPAVLDGSYLTFDESLTLTISGYAFANGSQKNIVWSVDKESWFKVAGGTVESAPEELVTEVMANGWIKTASGSNAVFDGVGADLSEYEGETLTVYFAVTPGADDKALNFLVIENVSVKAPEESTTAAPETADTDEESTALETEASQAESTEGDATDSDKTDKKPVSTVTFIIIGAAVLVIVAAVLVILKKKK